MSRHVRLAAAPATKPKASSLDTSTHGSLHIVLEQAEGLLLGSAANSERRRHPWSQRADRNQ